MCVCARARAWEEGVCMTREKKTNMSGIYVQISIIHNFFGQYRIVGHSSVIDINLQVVKDSQSTYLEQSCVCDAFQSMLSSILCIALLYNL